LAIENWTKTFILGGETDLVSVYEKLSQLLGKQAYRENLLKRALDFLHLQVYFTIL
jgi:hypothetical protein